MKPCEICYGTAGLTCSSLYLVFIRAHLLYSLGMMGMCVGGGGGRGIQHYMWGGCMLACAGGASFCSVHVLVNIVIMGSKRWVSLIGQHHLVLLVQAEQIFQDLDLYVYMCMILVLAFVLFFLLLLFFYFYYCYFIYLFFHFLLHVYVCLSLQASYT